MKHNFRACEGARLTGDHGEYVCGDGIPVEWLGAFLWLPDVEEWQRLYGGWTACGFVGVRRVFAVVHRSVWRKVLICGYSLGGRASDFDFTEMAQDRTETKLITTHH